jgi:hypothetical protein
MNDLDVVNKVLLVHAMKAYGGSGGIIPHH